VSGKGRFRYALEPVLLKRQWDLDALLLDLGHVNSVLSKLKGELKELIDAARDASENWKQQSASGLIDVSRFSLLTQYMQDLAVQCAAREKEIAAKEHERGALIDRVIAAQRGVDAVETHRDEMKAKFIKLRLNEDFKSADDHWSTLEARMENHDSRS